MLLKRGKQVDSKEFLKTATDKFGKRVENHTCIFCQNVLAKNEYCSCKKAEKINKYFQKAERLAERIEHLKTVCSEKELISLIKKDCNIPTIFLGFELEDYIIKNESQRKVLFAISEYRKNIIENFLIGKNLIMFGNYGTGKTMLMSILCDIAAEEYLFDCKFINIVDLLQEIQSSFKGEKDTAKIIEKYKTADFLFLDDIDKKTPTQYLKEILYSFVNYRIEKQLPIVVSFNHTLEELDSSLGEDIVSRLAGNAQVVHFAHENMRIA